MNDTQPCPCGAATTYLNHCGVVHQSGAGLGVTAESLMRARYSAYVLHNRAFLLDSWHPDTRPSGLVFDPELTWLGLEIVETQAGTGLDSSGLVEYKAKLTRGGEFLEVHERSSFARVDGRWMYITGD